MQRFQFRAIDPARPPSESGDLGRISALVAEAATWFVEDPLFTEKGIERPALRSPSVEELGEAIQAAVAMVNAKDGAGDARLKAKAALDAAGSVLVDSFCDCFIRKEPAYSLRLRNGRSIGQRQLLCAMALHQLEHAARAIAAGDAVRVAALMVDVLELICEVRRALDREAGSDVAVRRARKRHERTYRIRARAIELFEATDSGPILKRSRAIYKDVSDFAKEIGAPPDSYEGAGHCLQLASRPQELCACAAGVIASARTCISRPGIRHKTMP